MENGFTIMLNRTLFFDILGLPADRSIIQNEVVT